MKHELNELGRRLVPILVKVLRQFIDEVELLCFVLKSQDRVHVGLAVERVGEELANEPVLNRFVGQLCLPMPLLVLGPQLEADCSVWVEGRDFGG